MKKIQQNYLLDSLHNFYRESRLPAFITYGDTNLGEAIADKASDIYNEKVQKLKEFTCCEVGIGRGLVSKGFLNRMKEVYPEIYEKTSLILVDLSKMNLEKSKINLSQHKEKVHFINTDSVNLPLINESVDFLYSNELLDALPFNLYQRNGNSWYLTDYKKDDKTILVREKSPEQEQEKKFEEKNGVFSQQNLGPPKLKRFITPHKIQKSDIKINSLRKHSYLDPVGAYQFLNESNRIMKKGSHAMHIDYFSKSPYDHKLRIFLPDTERKIEVKLQCENGKLNSVMIPENFINMFDVTYDVPIGIIKKHAEKLKLKTEMISPQGLAFKETAKGNERCIFVGELQTFMNCLSFSQMFRERTNSEQLYDVNRIKQMIDERYTFFVPLQQIRDKVNDYFYNILEKFAMPYWFGISIEKMPEIKSKLSYDEIPNELAIKYKTLIIKKN